MSVWTNLAARRRAIVHATAFALLLLGVGVRSEETAAPPAGTFLRIEHAESAYVKEVNGEEVWVARGNVSVRYGGTVFRADAVVLWPDTQEMYVEGNIALTREDMSIEADSVYYDARNGTGLIRNGTIRFRPGGAEVPVLVHGKSIRILGENEYELRDGWMTTCDFARPHYRIQARRVRLRRESPQKPWRVSARDNAFYVGELPIFYFPYYAGSVSRSLIRSVEAGSSSRFQGTVRSDLRLYENEWLDAGLNIDFLERRGLGSGVALEMDGKGWSSILDTYYIHDNGTDRGDVEPPRRDRGRAHLTYRGGLTEVWQADVELHYVSDRNFLREFFEDEFYEEKAPESYLYLKGTGESSVLSSLVKQRVNDFQTETDYLPQLRAQLLRKPLFGSRLYLDSDWQVANVVRRFDTEMPLSGADALADGRRIWRFDANNELKAPFSVSALQIVPSVVARYSAFEEELRSENAADRLVGSYQVSFSTQLWRTFDFESELLDIDRVRHVFFPEIQYHNTYDVTKDPQDLIPFDEVEEVGREESVRLRMRHTLETKRGPADGKNVADLLVLDLSSSFFPNADRDNEGKEFSGIEGDLVWHPRRTADVLARWVYDPYEGDMDRGSVGFSLTPPRPWALSADYRYVSGVSSTASATFDYKLTPKWRLRLYSQYDFRENESAGYSVGFSRDLHMWVLETAFGFDRGADNLSFTFNFWPKGLFGRQAAF